MLMKLPPETRFESGLDAMLGAKNYAFVPIAGRGSFVGLGVAIKGQDGYQEVPLTHCHSNSYSEMESYAKELNRAAGLTDEEAIRIITASMRPIRNVEASSG